MELHLSTFKYLVPTDRQKEHMEELRKVAAAYASVIETIVPDGPDKTYILRQLRGVAMWVNVAITREADGTPRVEHDDPDL